MKKNLNVSIAQIDSLQKLGKIASAGMALANAAIEFQMNPEDLQGIVLGYAKKKIKERQLNGRA